MSAPPLPIRPRFAEHARVRRHVIDGEEVVVVHDARTGDLLRMGTREWELVAGMDGTRDFDALVLAAAQRGVFRRASELRAVLDHLSGAGLLADGIELPPIAAAIDADRPLDVLPRFSLTCDASGDCCGTYGSVMFTPLEAARARSLRPDVLGGGEREDRVFSPSASRAPGGGAELAVALVDGRCAYLDGDGRCSLHVIGGESAKPRGCRVYPATFVDDGETVRVSIGVECACVLASAGREGGAPLVDAATRTRGDLGPAARVAVLPEAIAITSASSVARAVFVAWSRLVAPLVPGEDADLEGVDFVALLWSLAAVLDASGLDEAETKRAIAEARKPEAADLAPWIDALAAQARARVASAEAWRSARDRSRRASTWIAEAAGALCDPASCATALDVPARFRRDEALFVRATIHAHALAGDVSIADALRDRAVRLVLARALHDALPLHEPSRAHPLAIVEAMMRGHGLAAYAKVAVAARSAV